MYIYMICICAQSYCFPFRDDNFDVHDEDDEKRRR